MRIENIDNLDKKYLWRDSVGLITKSLGTAAGSEKLYVNIDVVPPKAYSTKYHSHSQQEEFFLILEGNGTLRLNNQEYSVTKGDFIAKPASKNLAHTFFNSGECDLIILDAGTVEKEDTCYYPDEHIYLHKSNGVSKVFKEKSHITEWNSDPNSR